MKTKTKISQKPLKIAIIGAGPAGNFTAYLLSKLGHDVSIYEQKSELKRRVCGEYLCPQGVELLKEYHLEESLLKGFEKLHGMVLNDVKNDRTIKAFFPKLTKNYAGSSVNRKIFDDRLLELAQNTGVKVFLNHRLIKFNENKIWQLTFEYESREITDEVDFLIAADGRNSFIAKSLKHSPKIDTSRIALHCYIPRKKDIDLRLGEMHIFQDGSYCGLNPINQNEVNFSIVCDSSQIKNKHSMLELMNQKIRESNRLKEMFQPIEANVEIKTSSPLSHKNSVIAYKNLAYVGDASGFIDPLTGEGIYNALLSGHLLSEAMINSKDLETALLKYKNAKIKVHFQKKILNTIFQTVIRNPKVVTFISLILQTNQDRANVFIGIIGNIFSPIEGILRMFKPSFFSKKA